MIILYMYISFEKHAIRYTWGERRKRKEWYRGNGSAVDWQIVSFQICQAGWFSTVTRQLFWEANKRQKVHTRKNISLYIVHKMGMTESYTHSAHPRTRHPYTRMSLPSPPPATKPVFLFFVTIISWDSPIKIVGHETRAAGTNPSHSIF
jgi:hypothetical protein